MKTNELKPGHDSYDQIEPTSWSHSPPKSGSQTRRGDAGRLELASDCAVLIGDIQRGHPGTDDASPSLRPNLRLARLYELLKQNKTKQNKTKQNKTKQNKTKQNKTKQNKTKQNKKQNKTKQNKTPLRRAEAQNYGL